MKKLIRGCWQVVLDVVVGLAVYYVLSMVTIPIVNNDYRLIITLVVTSIFAEIWEVKKK